MPWKEPEHSEPTQPIQKQGQNVVETQKKDTNTRLNIHPKVGEIVGSGQLASRNSFLSLPLHDSWARKDHPLSVSLIPLSSIWLPFVWSTCSHTSLNSYMNSSITATPLPVPVIALYACQHTYVQTYPHVRVCSALTWTSLFLSLLSSCHLANRRDC